jgi:ketosteroid isomerase-like protein
MSTATPEQVVESIVDGINSGNLDTLMSLYESEAAFATQPGSLAHGPAGVSEALAGFISMNGKLDLQVTRTGGATRGRLARLARLSEGSHRPWGGANSAVDPLT